MMSSTFLQPKLTHLADRKVARGHDADGVPDQFIPPQDTPEIPAASLWTTAQDYMIFLRYCCSNEFLNQNLFFAHTDLNAEEFPKVAGQIHKIKWGLGIGLLEAGRRKIAFQWGHVACAQAFAAIDVNTGDGVACFVNCLNGPNVFKHLTQAVVGDINPVFDWLGNYFHFNAVVKSKNQETSDLVLFSKNHPVSASPNITNESCVHKRETARL
jgi:hypothetical protein